MVRLSHRSAEKDKSRARIARHGEYSGEIGRNNFKAKGNGAMQIVRSLITLKGLTYAPTGGLVAALTTSLPEQIGGVRNWDYRYCWLRDAALILLVLMRAGYREEADILAPMAAARHRRQPGTNANDLRRARRTPTRLSMRFRGCQDTKTPGRCASATQLQISFSSMCMAKCWPRCGRLIVPESK